MRVKIDAPAELLARHKTHRELLQNEWLELTPDRVDGYIDATIHSQQQANDLLKALLKAVLLLRAANSKQ